MDNRRSVDRAALYLRLSRDDDDRGESQSIRNQRMLLRDYAARQGFAVVGEYVDDGWSGTRFDRPRFQDLMCDMEQHQFDVVLVKDLSRLGRDYIQIGRYLELVFPAYGVRLIAVNDGIDTARADTDLVPFRNVVNEMYARDTSRKIRSALQAKRKVGKFVGNFAPYGYQKDPQDKNHLLPDERAAAVVRRIFAQAAAGVRPAAIARGLNAGGEPPPAVYRCLHHPGLDPDNYSRHKQWTSAGVSRILQDIVYLGHLAQGKTGKISFKSKKTREKQAGEWIIVRDRHEPLVSKQIFDAVQRQRAARRCDRKGAFQNLFSGLAFCADCGKAMSTVGTRKRGSAANLACGAYKLHGSSACTNHFIRYETLYQCVLEAVRRYVCLTEEECDALFERLNCRLHLDARTDEAGRARARLEKALERTRRLVAQLYEDRTAGRIGETNFYPLLEKFEQQTRDLQTQRDGLPDGDGMDSLQQQQARLRAIIRRYADIGELTPALLFALIERIEVGQGTYEKTEKGRAKRQKIRIFFRFLPEPCEIEWKE
nr:recombinase family protein [uncultured Agathobaculum sp.]